MASPGPKTLNKKNCVEPFSGFLETRKQRTKFNCSLLFQSAPKNGQLHEQSHAPYPTFCKEKGQVEKALKFLHLKSRLIPLLFPELKTSFVELKVSCIPKPHGLIHKNF